MLKADVGPAGYAVAYGVAADNRHIGRTVIADSVNSIAITRDAWLEVAHRAGVRAVEVGVICSDAAEHRRYVETRISDIDGLKLPNWQDVTGRHYEVWPLPRIVVDTAVMDVEAQVSWRVERLR